MILNDLISKRDNLNLELSALENEYAGLIKVAQSLSSRLKSYEHYEILLGKVIEVLDYISGECEKKSKATIEDLISYGLNAIFGEQDKFSISLETKARSIYAYLSLGTEKQDLLQCKGGGYVDLISVLFVVSLLLKEKPELKRFLVLDESFAEVGRAHLDKVGEFLRILSDKLGITILLITHSQELLDFGDIIYNVSKPDNYTMFEKIENKNLIDVTSTVI